MWATEVVVSLRICAGSHVALNRFKPSSKIFYWPFQGGTSFVDLLCFCSVLCLLCFVRVCLYVLCGHLLGKGWPLGSRLWCLLWVCHFPIGILGQVWYLIVSIPDLCNLITLLLTSVITIENACAGPHSRLDSHQKHFGKYDLLIHEWSSLTPRGWDTWTMQGNRTYKQGKVSVIAFDIYYSVPWLWHSCLHSLVFVGC